jgi:hypothetical protein
VAVLVGYGASAVCPFLGLESVRQYRNAPRTKTLIKNGAKGVERCREM